ncbi:hypothetical protein QU38_02375, partial [Staphylococcus aureus]
AIIGPQVEIARLARPARAAADRGVTRMDTQEGLEAVREQCAHRLVGTGLPQIAEALVLPPAIAAAEIERHPANRALGIEQQVFALGGAAAIEPVAVGIVCLARIAGEIHGAVVAPGKARAPDVPYVKGQRDRAIARQLGADRTFDALGLAIALVVDAVLNREIAVPGLLLEHDVD